MVQFEALLLHMLEKNEVDHGACQSVELRTERQVLEKRKNLLQYEHGGT
jgi:hypothetical protein